MPDRSSVHADGPVPDGLLAAFDRYEAALMADDVPVLDELFAPGPHTLRGDASGLLVGAEAIAAFRRGGGGAPARRIAAAHVRVLRDDAALVIAVVLPDAGGRGQQTQLWRRLDAGWRVAAAHVSAPAPAVDSRIWRTVGTPLLEGAARGPLQGERVAVKDLFAVAGHRIGAGVPAYLDRAAVEQRTAPAVAALLDAGAGLTGIARTDEFAYSIAGANPHYGTPPNAAVPGALPGGSSSGPASAVAAGQASIGLATDTAGSIRVPASYQGLWGLRTTHGAVDRDGVLPLAPSFDTVGWLARDPQVLARAAAVSLPLDTAPVPAAVAVAPTLLEGLAPAVRDAFDDALRHFVADGLIAAPDEVDFGDPDALVVAFRTVQAAEAWRSHGAWLTARPDAVSGAVAERFRIAAQVTGDEEAAAREELAAAGAQLDTLLADRILLLPAAASPAPSATSPAAVVDQLRAATLRLTCVAAAAGAPSLSVPLLTVAGAPLGLALVGPPGSDLSLIEAGARLADAD
ncbi:MAG: atzE [Naasia sp.]|nr:atzE [Naasia sp.]